MVHSGGPPNMAGAGESPAHPSNALSYLIATSPSNNAGARASQQALLRSNAHLRAFSGGAPQFDHRATQPVQLPATNAFSNSGSFGTNSGLLFGHTVPPVQLPATNAFLADRSLDANNGLLFGRTGPRVEAPATNAFPADRSFLANNGLLLGRNVPPVQTPATNAFLADQSFETYNGLELEEFLFGSSARPVQTPETNAFSAARSLETNNGLLFGRTVPPPPSNGPPPLLFSPQQRKQQQLPALQRVQSQPSQHFVGNGTGASLLPLSSLVATRLRPETWAAAPNCTSDSGALPPLPPQLGQRLPPQTWAAVPSSRAESGAPILTTDQGVTRFAPQTWSTGNAGACQVPADRYQAGSSAPPPMPPRPQPPCVRAGVSAPLTAFPEPNKSFEEFLVGSGILDDLPTTAPSPLPRALPAPSGGGASGLGGVERADGPVSGIARGNRRLSTFVARLGAYLRGERMVGLGTGAALVPGEASAAAEAMGGQGTVCLLLTPQETSDAPPVGGGGGTVPLHPTAEETLGAAPVGGGGGTVPLYPTADETSEAAPGRRRGTRRPRESTVEEETLGAASLGRGGTVRRRRPTVEEATPGEAAHDGGQASADDAKERRMQRIAKRKEEDDTRRRVRARKLAAARAAGDYSQLQDLSGSSSSTL